MNFLHNILQAFIESPTLFLVYATVIGFLVGSFLNVVIYRLPVMMENAFRDEYEEYFHPEAERPEREKFNLITPRSRCPKCGHKISAWENIPVISYLILRGKCRGCGGHISLRYPIVETLTGLTTLLVAWHFGPTVQVAGALLVAWSLIAASGIDFDKMLIPDEIVIPLLWLGILFNTREVFVPLTDSIYGAVAGYMSLWSVYVIFKAVTGKEGMGFGDFKLTACLGAWFGYQMLPAIIFGSAIIGAVTGGVFMIVRRKKESLPFAYGPCIAFMGFLVMMWGDRINEWGLRLLA